MLHFTLVVKTSLNTRNQRQIPNEDFFLAITKLQVETLYLLLNFEICDASIRKPTNSKLNFVY